MRTGPGRGESQDTGELRQRSRQANGPRARSIAVAAASEGRASRASGALQADWQRHADEVECAAGTGVDEGGSVAFSPLLERHLGVRQCSV